MVLGERRIWRSCRAAISKGSGKKEGVSSILGHEDRMTAFLWIASGRESSAQLAATGVAAPPGRLRQEGGGIKAQSISESRFLWLSCCATLYSALTRGHSAFS